MEPAKETKFGTKVA